MLKRNDIVESKFQRGLLVTILQFPATPHEPCFYTRPTLLENKISSPLKRILLTDEQGRRTSLYPLLCSQRIL